MSKTRPPASSPKAPSPKAPKAPKARRARRTRRPSAERTVDVISQLACATRHPRAAVLGGLLGGAVPWFARALAHGEIPQAWAAGQSGLVLVMLAVVLGCAAFSMLTVYKFGSAAFGDERKAAGFVLALEGVMLVSHGATSVAALGLLVIINAIANGCVIALAREATERRQAADARRSQTKQNRARRGEAPVASVPASAPAPRAIPTSAPAPRVIPVVQGHPAPARRPARPTPPALVARPRWSPEVIEDAEIVSEAQCAYS